MQNTHSTESEERANDESCVYRPPHSIRLLSAYHRPSTFPSRIPFPPYFSLFQLYPLFLLFSHTTVPITNQPTRDRYAGDVAKSNQNVSQRPDLRKFASAFICNVLNNSNCQCGALKRQRNFIVTLTLRVGVQRAFY